MAKGKWKVQCNVVGGRYLYIPYRVRNLSEVIHSGNIEHYGEYTEDQAEAQAICDRLNNEEGGLDDGERG